MASRDRITESRAPALALAVALPLTLALSPSASLMAQGDHGIPRPATDTMEPQVAELLETTWAGLATWLDADSDSPSETRAAAVGEACEIFHAHGSVDPAIACYRRASELDPSSARWPYLLGYMLKNRGQTQESLDSLRRAETLEPDALTRFRIGEVLVADGRVDEARTVLEPLSDIDGLRAAVAAELGQLALLEGDAPQAVARLTAALELQPDAVSLHFPLAQAQRLLGNATSAEHHASLAGQRQVRVVDPILQQVGERSVSSETYVNMGAQALRSGDLETAVAAYGEAVTLNPTNQRAWMNLGTIALEAGQLDEAEEYLIRALTLDPEYGFAHFNLAKVMQRRQQPQRALEHYRAAVGANPRNVEFGLAYGDALMRAHELQAAADQYRRVADAAPEFARPHYLRALALAALGQVDQAAEAIAAAWDLAADDEDIARAFVRLVSTAHAADGERRRQALEVARRLFDAHRSTDEGELVAMALAANGDFEQAVATQTQVVQTLRRAGVNGSVTEFLEANLEAYRRGQVAQLPWVEPVVDDSAPDRRASD